MSASLDDGTINSLHVFGELFNQQLAFLTFETALWGGYSILFLGAVYRLLQPKSPRTLRPKALTLAPPIFFLYISSTTMWALNITVALTRTRERLSTNADIALEDRVALSDDRVKKFGVFLQALYLFNMEVGDALVISRAWKLWRMGGRIRWLICIPLTFLVASIAFACLSVSCLATFNFSTTNALLGETQLCNWTSPISWGFSIFTKGTSTGMIAFKVWKKRNAVRSGLTSLRTNRPLHVLFLLVESGALYFIFWLLQLIVLFDIPFTSRGSYAWYCFRALGEQGSGMYSTILVLLVSAKKTVFDVMHRDHSFVAGRESTIQFARSPTTSFTGAVVTRHSQIGMRLTPSAEASLTSVPWRTASQDSPNASRTSLSRSRSHPSQLAHEIKFDTEEKPPELPAPVEVSQDFAVTEPNPGNVMFEKRATLAMKNLLPEKGLEAPMTSRMF